MSVAIICPECLNPDDDGNLTVYLREDERGPAFKTSYHAHRRALEHAKATGHLEVMVFEGIHWIGEESPRTDFPVESE